MVHRITPTPTGMDPADLGDYGFRILNSVKDKSSLQTFENILGRDFDISEALTYLFLFAQWVIQELLNESSVGYHAAFTTTSSPDVIEYTSAVDSDDTQIDIQTGGSIICAEAHSYSLVAYAAVTVTGSQSATLQWYDLTNTVNVGLAITISAGTGYGGAVPVVYLAEELTEDTTFQLRKVSHTGGNEPVIETIVQIRQHPPTGNTLPLPPTDSPFIT